jgi:hypothetical protein
MSGSKARAASNIPLSDCGAIVAGCSLRVRDKFTLTANSFLLFTHFRKPRDLIKPISSNQDLYLGL